MLYNKVAVTGDVVKLVDTLVLGASALRRGGSSPLIPTKVFPNMTYQQIVAIHISPE